MKAIKLMTFAVLSMMILSCGEDDKPKDVNVKLEMVVDDESLSTGTTYNINDTDIQFTNVAFYLGKMSFETSTGATFTNQGDDQYQLIEPGVYDYNFSIPVDEDGGDVSLDKVSFIIGVDAETNDLSEDIFDARPESDPLSAQDPSMHWGWMGQYKFLNIDGNADLDGDGTFETPLTYHIGRNIYLGNITLSPDEELEGGANDFRIEVDLAELLDDVDFATQNFTKAGPDQADLTNTIVGNYDDAIEFEK